MAYQELLEILSRWAFRLASPLARWLRIGWIFEHWGSLLPVKRLSETDRLLAFYHPRPAYPLHILIVPKRSIPGLEALSPADNQLLIEVIQMARQLATQLGFNQDGWSLVINAGDYQTISQLHFHLISE